MKNFQHKFGVLFFFLLGFGVFAQTEEETIIDVMSKSGNVTQSPESCPCRPTYSPYSQIEVDALNAINAHRQSIGLSQLTLINHISNNCLDHCNYMIANNVASHDYFTARADNIMCALNSAGVGEIVAYNFSSGNSVVNAWLGSTGHRAVIEGPLYTGFGISMRANSNGNKYYTCMFTRQPSGSCSTIPTIIPFACDNSLTLNSQVTTGVDKKQAVTSIEARNIVNIGAGAIYHAGSTVVLKSGFNAKAGSTFRAYIAGCTGSFIARTSNNSEEESSIDANLDLKKSIKIYPNPSNSMIIVSTEDFKMKQISISSTIDNRVILTQRIENLDSVEVDVSKFAKGIYIVSIESISGEILTQKLIKN